QMCEGHLQSPLPCCTISSFQSIYIDPAADLVYSQLHIVAALQEIPLPFNIGSSKVSCTNCTNINPASFINEQFKSHSAGLEQVIDCITVIFIICNRYFINMFYCFSHSRSPCIQHAHCHYE